MRSTRTLLNPDVAGWLRLLLVIMAVGWSPPIQWLYHQWTAPRVPSNPKYTVAAYKAKLQAIEVTEMARPNYSAHDFQRCMFTLNVVDNTYERPAWNQYDPDESLRNRLREHWQSAVRAELQRKNPAITESQVQYICRERVMMAQNEVIQAINRKYPGKPIPWLKLFGWGALTYGLGGVVSLLCALLFVLEWSESLTEVKAFTLAYRYELAGVGIAWICAWGDGQLQKPWYEQAEYWHANMRREKENAASDALVLPHQTLDPSWATIAGIWHVVMCSPRVYLRPWRREFRQAVLITTMGLLYLLAAQHRAWADDSPPKASPLSGILWVISDNPSLPLRGGTSLFLDTRDGSEFAVYGFETQTPVLEASHVWPARLGSFSMRIGPVVDYSTATNQLTEAGAEAFFNARLNPKLQLLSGPVYAIMSPQTHELMVNAPYMRLVTPLDRGHKVWVGPAASFNQTMGQPPQWLLGGQIEHHIDKFTVVRLRVGQWLAGLAKGQPSVRLDFAVTLP